MKNKQRVFTVILSSLVSVFLVAGAVMATTTVGLNINTGGTADIESYAAVGNGSALSANNGLIVDYDATYTAAGAQVKVLGTVTNLAATNAYGVYIAPQSITNISGTTALIASLYVNEPVVTVTAGTVTNAATVYIAAMPTEGTGNAGLQMGISGTPLDLSTTATNKAIEIYTTSGSVTTGTSVEPIYMKSVMTGAGGVGGRANFHMYTNVALGGWANALKGYTEFGSSGAVTGLASAVLAEMKMPSATLSGGNYAPLELELVLQTLSRTGGTPVSFMHAQASEGGASSGDGWGDFNDNGYFMSVQGLAAEADHLLSLTSQTLKTRIGSSTRYMVLSQMQDGLGLGNSTTAMDLTSTPGNKAVEIHTTSSSVNTGTSVEPIKMVSTMTGIGGVGGRALFQMNTNVALGGWANALKGYTEFGNSGSVTGLASAVLAEMKMPSATLSGGNYAPLEIELVLQENSRTGGTPVSFMHAQASQATNSAGIGDFNDTGYFMSVQGLTAGESDIFEATTNTDSMSMTHTLRILIGGTAYYIPLNTSKEF